MMATEGEDEEDYMSDAFLAKIVDTRPGLSKGDSKKPKKRKSQEQSESSPGKSSNSVKSLKLQRSENLQMGLNTSLGSDNKGFKMLEKMGFKKGMNLGKKGDGRSEPVPITLKQGRTGLGLEAHRRIKQHEANLSRVCRAKQRQKIEAGFRERLTGRNTDKQAEKDLYKSQKACQHLDEAKGLEEPAVTFYWPNGWKKTTEEENVEESEDFPGLGYDNHYNEEGEEEDVGEDLTTDEKLEALTAYLREEHLYCIWCGTAYDDPDDMNSNCPGSTSADHDD